MPARPWGSRSHRLRDPQGLEGTITCLIVYWRDFFILFDHFIEKMYVYFGELLLKVTMLYIFSAKQYYEPNVCAEVVTTYFNIRI